MKKLRGFVKRKEGEPMKRFGATGATTIEYETISGKKGVAEIYQDSNKKWKFKKPEGEKDAE